VRDVSLWGSLLGVEKTVIERIEYDEDADLIVAHVRPTSRQRSRCGACGRRCPGYDLGAGRRTWRALDLGTVRAVLEAHAPRVMCREHGVVVAAVPWARHDAGHTYAFDETVAWLATQSSKSTVTVLMRIAWRTVGSIITRVWVDVDAQHDRLAGLRRIGIDEISYKRGFKFLMVVVDHDTRRLVWAAPGRTNATVRQFFDLLGADRCAQITHVSADGADFIDTIVAQACPNAVRVADPFHVVKWATEALDEVRRGAWNDARALARTEPKRGRGRPRADAPPRPGSERAVALKGARYSLWKNPENLSENQQIKLAWIAATDPRLHRAYLLKEGLRVIFAMPYHDAVQALEKWIGWARRCRVPAFVKLQKSIVRHRGQDPRRDQTQPVQRLDRIDQHQDPADHPDSVRIQVTPSPHRPRPTQPRRPPTNPPRAQMTHGYVRRAASPPRIQGSLT
jgi:transposase